jgi:hypothetical protein
MCVMTIVSKYCMHVFLNFDCDDKRNWMCTQDVDGELETLESSHHIDISLIAGHQLGHPDVVSTPGRRTSEASDLHSRRQSSADGKSNPACLPQLDP